MKKLLPILMVFGVFLGSAGEGFALPECKGSPMDTTEPMFKDALAPWSKLREGLNAFIKEN